MVNPVPMNNTYAIARPNAIINLINYATKTVGQGVAIDANAQVFTFDEALALVALRYQMPTFDIPVYATGTTTASTAALVKGGLPYFTQVRISNTGRDLDLTSAILRAITHPSEVTGD